MMGGDGILGLGILPKPGQLSIAEIVGVRQLVKPETLSHLIAINAALPMGSDLTSMFSDIKSIRGLLKPETVLRITALTSGKQDSDLTINRIQKFTASDGKIPTYFGSQNLGTGIYTSLTSLASSKSDILDVASFYKTNKTKLTDLLSFDISGMKSYLDPTIKKYLLTDLKGGMRGLFLDDTQAFRLRLKNMTTRFQDARTGGIGENKYFTRAYQLLDSAQSQISSRLTYMRSVVDSLTSNLTQRTFSYGGYDFELGTCHYFDTATFTSTGFLQYLTDLRTRIKSWKDNKNDEALCGKRSHQMDAAFATASGMLDTLNGLGDIMGNLSSMIIYVKATVETLAGNVTLRVEGKDTNYTDGVFGALRQEIFNLTLQVNKVNTAYDNLSKEVDSLRSEIQEKLTTRFPLPG